MSSKEYVLARQAADHIQSILSDTILRPQIGVICGSGLNGLVSTFNPEPQISVPYAAIPSFPVSTVPGHESRLVFGTLGKSRTPVVAMVGRAHFYEGHDMALVGLPVRVLHLLGVKVLIVTNAAGALNCEYSVGDLVVIKDHINFPGLMGNHPLRGPNADEFGPRFPALSDAYSLVLRQTLFRAAKSRGLRSHRRLREGTYAMVSGPSYETRAEAMMIRSCGADVVGMSTVPEVIVARHCGMKVLCISLVTNMVVLDPTPSGMNENITEGLMTAGKANHEEVLQAGNDAAVEVQELIGLFVDLIQI